MQIFAPARFVGGTLGFLLLTVVSTCANDLPWIASTEWPVSALLLPPPCDSCKETKAELADLLELQKSRTREMAIHAQNDYERTLPRFLDDEEIGVRVERLSECGHCNIFFEGLKQLAETAVKVAKEKFRRTRPYNLPENGLVPLKEVRPDDSSSYPSGHAAFGTLAGIVLAEMLPEKRGQIFKRIGDYCRSRLLAGVHFRSDVAAGQVVGSVIAASLFRNEAFIREFEATKADLRSALGLQVSR